MGDYDKLEKAKALANIRETKIGEDTKRLIRDYMSGISPAKLSSRYGIHESEIENIIFNYLSDLKGIKGTDTSAIHAMIALTAESIRKQNEFIASLEMKYDIREQALDRKGNICDLLKETSDKNLYSKAMSELRFQQDFFIKLLGLVGQFDTPKSKEQGAMEKFTEILTGKLAEVAAEKGAAQARLDDSKTVDAPPQDSEEGELLEDE